MAVKPKNKKLAALAPPRNKVTKKDVLVGRGVIEAKRGRKIKKKKSTKKNRKSVKRIWDRVINII